MKECRNYDDATVNSNKEEEKAFSSLALKLADQIKALPKFCNRKTIAKILQPYVRESIYLQIKQERKD